MVSSQMQKIFDSIYENGERDEVFLAHVFGDISEIFENLDQAEVFRLGLRVFKHILDYKDFSMFQRTISLEGKNIAEVYEWEKMLKNLHDSPHYDELESEYEFSIFLKKMNVLKAAPVLDENLTLKILKNGI
jgi:hypothetical protein